jgi:DNA-binding Lrp family transcriptional regulator
MLEYPTGPGHRDVDTSVAAARDIEIALRAIRAAGTHGLTTNELSAQVRISRDSMQPRTSELRELGLIRDSGARRLNSNGKRAIVWIAGGAA